MLNHLLKCVTCAVLHLYVQIYAQVVLVVSIEFHYGHATIKLASGCLFLRLRL
jgi:hypothetical protein